jgi:hypothetical protein
MKSPDEYGLGLESYSRHNDIVTLPILGYAENNPLVPFDHGINY